ncbi:MAG: GNAT family N-acetyltransferase [Anaerolineaceae bacterium]|nr:GNAT family N-acetyltransferase [Anaerolineaceae bacterium]
MRPWRIRPIDPSDRNWIRQFVVEHWGAEEMVTHGEVSYPAQLPGFVCTWNGEVIGLVTYQIRGLECEIISLDSLRPQLGIGGALIDAVAEAARKENVTRLWLITTNDNLLALGFYQRRGFHICAVNPDAITQARKIKPSIPQIGLEGIPLRDEIVLEIYL